jgi:hypothetical protein
LLFLLLHLNYLVLEGGFSYRGPHGFQIRVGIFLSGSNFCVARGLPTPYDLTGDPKWDEDGDLLKLYDLELEKRIAPRSGKNLP